MVRCVAAFWRNFSFIHTGSSASDTVLCCSSGFLLCVLPWFPDHVLLFGIYIQTVKWLWWLMAEHQAMQVVLYISPPLPRSNCFAFFQRGPFMCVYGDDWRDGFHSNGHLLQIRMFCYYLALVYFQVVELHNWHTPAQLKVGKKVWRYNWGRDFPTRTQWKQCGSVPLSACFFTA